MEGITPYTDESWRKTNADRIRSMTDEELAGWLDNLTEVMMPWCDHPCPDGEQSICKNCISEWLRQEAE